MTRTIFYTATTLDGFLADEHDSLEWLLVQDIDHDGPFGYEDFISGIGALIMGATTYEWVVAHMRRTGEQWTYRVPTWVMTHRDLPAPDGADVRFASGDATAAHAEAAAAADGRDVWVVGGGDLVGQLGDEGLLDELMVSIAPVTLGAGRPLLPRRYALELLDVERNRAFVCARYRFLGPGDWGGVGD